MANPTLDVDPNSRATTPATAKVHSSHKVSGGKSVVEYALESGNPEPSKSSYAS